MLDLARKTREEMDELTGARLRPNTCGTCLFWQKHKNYNVHGLCSYTRLGRAFRWVINDLHYAKETCKRWAPDMSKM